MIDYHTHSSFSDGEKSFEEIILKAKKNGLKCIAITDHFDPFDYERPYCFHADDMLLEHFFRIKDFADKVNQKVLCGIETCTDYYGNLRINDKVYDNCEIIITSPHYIEYKGEMKEGDLFNEKYWECYKETVLNMALGKGHVLGHPESYLPYSKLLKPNTTTFEERIQLAREIADKFFDTIYLKQLITNLKISGKAYEIHCISKSPRNSVIEMLINNNIKISIGSDGHALKDVAEIEFAINVINKYHCKDLILNL